MDEIMSIQEHYKCDHMWLPCFRERFLSVMRVTGLRPITTGCWCGSGMGSWRPLVQCRKQCNIIIWNKEDMHWRLPTHVIVSCSCPQLLLCKHYIIQEATYYIEKKENKGTNMKEKLN